MSWRASGYVKELTTGLTKVEKLMMLILADYYSEEEEAAWPSLRRLAIECLMPIEGARRVRQSLADKGFITVKQRERSDGTFQSSLVRFPQLSNNTVKGGVPPTGRGGTPLPVSDEPSIEPSGGSEDDKSSSSSSQLDEIWLAQLMKFYKTIPSGLSSPIRAPSRYFRTVSKNEDLPPVCNLWEVSTICEQVREAFTQDHPEDSPLRKQRYTVPTPDLLIGLEQAWATLDKWHPSRHSIRIALMQFVQYDEGPSPEVEPLTILSRIAQRPDLFDRAVEGQARAAEN